MIYILEEKNCRRGSGSAIKAHNFSFKEEDKDGDIMDLHDQKRKIRTVRIKKTVSRIGRAKARLVKNVIVRIRIAWTQKSRDQKIPASFLSLCDVMWIVS